MTSATERGRYQKIQLHVSASISQLFPGQFTRKMYATNLLIRKLPASAQKYTTLLEATKYLVEIKHL